MKKREQCMAAVVLTLCLFGTGLFFVPGVRFSAYLCLCLAGIGLVWLVLCRLVEKSRAARWCKRLFAWGLALVTVALVLLEGMILTAGEEEPPAQVDAIIVLGAGVNGETPSLTLRTRIRAAEAYMQQHPDIPVVLSGGQGPGEDITEAACMRRELWREDQAWNARLLLEEKSTSTAENFACSKALLEQHGIDTETAVIGVVTNDFHIFRSRLIARREGLQVTGVPAELPWWWLSANYYVREAFALVKTLIFD